MNILQSGPDAEECVNDTYLRTWNAIPPSRPNRLQTFLGKITRNLSLNRYEKAAAQKRSADRTALVIEELEECIPAGGGDISDDLVIKELLDCFLASLSDDARRIFLRRYWYMCPVKEIARSMKLSESNVAVSLYRSREKLRQLLEKEGITI